MDARYDHKLRPILNRHAVGDNFVGMYRSSLALDCPGINSITLEGQSTFQVECSLLAACRRSEKRPCAIANANGSRARNCPAPAKGAAINLHRPGASS